MIGTWDVKDDPDYVGPTIEDLTINELMAERDSLRSDLAEAVRMISAMVNNEEKGDCQTLWSEKYTRENRLDSRVANHDGATAFLTRINSKAAGKDRA